MRALVLVRRTRRTPVYNIGMASRLTGLPVYTLRWVERAGLVCPGRSGGRQRLFSEADVALLTEVRRLLALRVNLSGIRVILTMRKANWRARRG